MGYKEGECKFSCKDKKQKCGMECSKHVHTGFEAGGHMQEHVAKLLALIDGGTITRPPHPSIPERPLRPHGDATLGEMTAAAHKATQARAARYASYMVEAQLCPEQFSRVVPLPVIDKSLVDRKIEMAWNMEVKDGEDFAHVFEGTIVEVVGRAADDKVRSVHGCRCKWAVVRVKWDALFGERDTWHPLNPDKYERQDGDKPQHQGWRLLNEEYVSYCSRIERALSQHGPAQKQKS